MRVGARAGPGWDRYLGGEVLPPEQKPGLTYAETEGLTLESLASRPLLVLFPRPLSFSPTPFHQASYLDASSARRKATPFRKPSLSPPPHCLSLCHTAPPH